MKIILVLIILAIVISDTPAQMKLKDDHRNENNSFYESANSETPRAIMLGSLFIINPDLSLENGKVYLGLTKALFIGKFPFGRAEFEYTYIFRSFGQNNIRLSYNIDVPLYAGDRYDMAAISPGFGYYTDAKRSGVFMQITIGLFGSVFSSRTVVFHPYLKFRRTFINGTKDPNFNDLSLGCAIGLYY